MSILTAEQLEAILNASVKDDLKRAVKALFKAGDIVEVRAWNKSHTIFTGRYNYGNTLIEMLELFDGEGECDVYYVLNPVGDKHGTRPLTNGGLCTWEADVPWRRRFLLDFDPKRDNKIATNEQWGDAYNTAFRAMTWLKSYGYKGIVMASSGNGCHLLVPCELPNDAASKELVRKVQRAVSAKFSTETVECECFPDANRLVRAYGSTNKKGDATDTMPHRRSMLAVMAEGVDENPKLIMERIIAENPVAEVTRNHKLGTGAGPFSRDLLYARLEAWSDGWQNDNGDVFLFEETDRKDGFQVLCPGALAEGWPDGEQHDSCSDSLNDSTIVYVENGWPRFSCRHNHCGEGAEHGKKTWADLQDFYDPERKLHRVLDEDGDAEANAKWNIEYLGDGYEDGAEADIDRLITGDDGEVFSIKVNPIQVSEVEPDTLVSKAAPEPEMVDDSEDDTAEPVHPVEVVRDDPAPRKRRGTMPESCMYGWLGQAARELETPLGFAYPAMLTVFAAQVTMEPKHVRPTLYTCLIGAVHCGKSETIKRAVKYMHFADPDTVKWTVPGSDRGLIKIFGDKKKDEPKSKDKDKADVPYGMEEAKPKLLAQDELRNTIAKANIQGSSLPSTLCSLWSQDEAGAADKTGEHTALVRLNMLGALKADDAEDFEECFGKESTSGLYDRFVYGLAPRDGWKYTFWEREAVYRMPKAVSVPDYCYRMVDEWREFDRKVRGRLGEIALRIAYITSAANHDTAITIEAMRCALEFCEWQEYIRTTYKAGMGDSPDAICTNAILSILEKVKPGEWVSWRELANKKSWYRKYGGRLLSSTRDAMAKSGLTIEEVIEEDGKPQRTGRLRLHMGKSEN